MATNGDIRWPARSPDLNPLDFYLWGKLKDLLYTTPVENAGALEERLRSAIFNISPDEILRASRNVITRSRVCLSQRGTQFEHLM